MNAKIIFFIIGVPVGIVVMLIVREINCWYWKINARLEKLDEIAKKLDEIKNKLN